jgi:hypothetical protein
MGGVRLPDVAVSVGTNGVQNEPHSFTCSLVGAFVPFAPTQQTREAAGDQRLSLAERYRDQDDYVNRIGTAVREAETAGFLLPEDAAVIVNSVAAAPIFVQPMPTAPPR